jgi:hypothetical protein
MTEEPMIEDKGDYSVSKIDSCPITDQILSNVYNANYQTEFSDIYTSDYEEDIIRLEKV